MLGNYYTLAVVAEDLDVRLRGKAINGAFTQSKNELILTFEGLPGALVVCCQPDVNTLYLHPDFSRARANSANVLHGVVGMRVGSVSIQSMDRVVSFRLDAGCAMYAQFFGSKANVLLVDDGKKVIDAFKDAKSVTGKEYSPAGGEIVHDAAMLQALVQQEPTQTVFASLKKASPVLGSALASEILFRSGLHVSSRARDATEEQLHQLQRSFTSVIAELSHPTPRVYFTKEAPHVPVRFSLVKLTHCAEFEEKVYSDIHEAIRSFISRSKSSGALKSESCRLVTILRQRKSKLARTIAAVEEDLKTTERADEYERHGTLLMANLAVLKKGMKSVTFADDSRSATISLDPKLTPVQNAQRYYDKAKKSRVAYAQSRERLSGLRATTTLADELLMQAEGLHTKEDVKKFMTERAHDLEQFGIGEKSEQHEQLPFRIFTVEGGFEVWAGKSSKNNDELTMKHAKPNDLWFHARGSSGSHVILKVNTGKGEPGKKAKEQAAAIAAYYSKMKNATMVPVAMTEKKYVRKPKGAPPGTVVLEREKVIFAEPALPDNAR